MMQLIKCSWRWSKCVCMDSESKVASEVNLGIHTFSEVSKKVRFSDKGCVTQLHPMLFRKIVGNVCSNSGNFNKKYAKKFQTCSLNLEKF